MTVYADTPWWIACKCRDDANHPTAIRLFDLWPEAQILWMPWHRVEVFNSLRLLTFDREQQAFAEAAGLRVLRLSAGRSR